MKDIIVFISPNFEQKQTAKIADLLRIHDIKTINNIHEATVILTPNNLKNNLANLALSLKMEELRIEAEQKLEFVPHVLEPNSLPETNKKTYTKYQIPKKFNKTKQIMYKHACINRVRKR